MGVDLVRLREAREGGPSEFDDYGVLHDLLAEAVCWFL